MTWLDCVWLCKLNERGMLRRSFVPVEALRDLRSLTRLRARLAAEQASHQPRIEKVLEDALIKVSSVISKLASVSGRQFLDALVAGEPTRCGWPPWAIRASRPARLNCGRR